MLPQEVLLPHMGLLTDSARRIGAVNTITVRLAADGSRILVGDNTDWVAIHRLVEQVHAWDLHACIQQRARDWFACVFCSFPDQRTRANVEEKSKGKS